tara:strand:+ start:524 stop:718 length:195 start_codon:yes stop_codon:yes gene_type:complete
MPATKEELKVYNRYEVRVIRPHERQDVVGIYQDVETAKHHRSVLFRAQGIPVVVYDIIKQERVQ